MFSRKVIKEDKRLKMALEVEKRAKMALQKAKKQVTIAKTRKKHFSESVTFFKAKLQRLNSGYVK